MLTLATALRITETRDRQKKDEARRDPNGFRIVVSLKNGIIRLASFENENP